MNAVFAVLFCAILGLANGKSKHLIETETDEDLKQLLDSDKPAYDEEQMMRLKQYDYSESLKLLKDCLDAGRDKHGCFKEFMDHAKPDVLSKPCFDKLQNCYFSHTPMLDCLNEFGLCLGNISS